MLLEAEGLRKSFKHGLVLRDLNLQLQAGEVLGVIGESGCGKSTLARLLTGLLSPDAGTIRYAGQDPRDMSRRDRAQFIQMMFQDSGAALHPRMQVGAALREVLTLVRHMNGTDAETEILRWLPQLDLPRDVLERFPHQLSGGQKQRVCLLRALLLKPRILVCDEPLTALDRMTGARVLSIFQTLRHELGFALIFISHDITTVQSIADRVAVMYAGQWMEAGPTQTLLARPEHPYTRFLLQSLPKLYRQHQLAPIPPFQDAAHTPEQGCPLRLRCPFALDLCAGPLPKFASNTYSACLRQASTFTDQ